MVIDPEQIEKLKAIDRTLTEILKLPPHASGRSFPPYARKAIEDYAKLVGEVTWASNTLHSTLAKVFAQLVQPGTLLFGLALWNAIKADTGQRDILKAAATARGLEGLKIAPKIIWVCDKVGDISAHRNAAVHTPMAALVDAKGKWKPFPVPGASPKPARRLDAERYKRLFISLRGDLIALNHYASAMSSYLGALHFERKPEPLPKRPSLQCLKLAPPAPAGRPVRPRPRRPQRRASPVK